VQEYLGEDKMKRLIRKSELYDAFNIDNSDDLFEDINFDGYNEVFKNPTAKEIQSLKEASNNTIRGMIYSNGDMYIWNGYILHDFINNYTNQKLNINEFRFSYDPSLWFIDAHNKYTLKELLQLIESYKSKLSQIGDLNIAWEVIYCKGKGQVPPRGTLENIKKWVEINEKIS